MTFVMVINQLNYKEILKMIQFAVNFKQARLSFKSASLTEDTEEYALSKFQKNQLIKKDIPEAVELAYKHKINHNLDILTSQLTGENNNFPIEKLGCFAGLLYSRIYASKDVFYCCAHIKIGNLDNVKFSEIWQSENYRKMRKRLDDKKFFPDCKKCGKYNLNFEAKQLLEELLSE